MDHYSFSLCYIFILFVVHKGAALKCFTCTSPFGGYCDDPSEKNPPEVKECSTSFPTCYHLVHNVNAIKGQSAFVQRGCMEGTICNTTIIQEPVNRFCYTCNLNLCNNVTLYHKNITADNEDDDDDEDKSNNIKPSIVVLVTSLLMLVLDF